MSHACGGRFVGISVPGILILHSSIGAIVAKTRIRAKSGISKFRAEAVAVVNRSTVEPCRDGHSILARRL